MKNIQLLQVPVINNSKLTQIFGCSLQGEMLRLKKTNTLVFISGRFSPNYYRKMHMLDLKADKNRLNANFK